MVLRVKPIEFIGETYDKVPRGITVSLNGEEVIRVEECGPYQTEANPTNLVDDPLIFSVNMQGLIKTCKLAF